MYEELAKLDKKRYHDEMDAYKEKKSEALSVAQQELEKTVDVDTLRRYLAGEGNKSSRSR